MLWACVRKLILWSHGVFDRDYVRCRLEESQWKLSNIRREKVGMKMGLENQEGKPKFVLSSTSRLSDLFTQIVTMARKAWGRLTDSSAAVAGNF